jgi:PAS domain S-box-containing protein
MKGRKKRDSVRGKSAQSNRTRLTAEAKPQRNSHAVAARRPYRFRKPRYDFPPRNQLEAVLERFTELYETAPLPFVSFDRIGRIEEANLAFGQLVGRPRNLILGCPFSAFVHPTDLQLFLNHVLACRKGQSIVETELRLRHRDHSPIQVYLSSSGRALQFAAGAGLFQTAVVDLTERKRGEEQQAAIHRFVQRWHEAESLDQIYEAALDAMFVSMKCDHAYILLFNDAEKMRHVAGRNVSDSYRKAIDGHSPWLPATIHPDPIWFPNVAISNLPARIKKAIRTEGIVSCGYVPLLSAEDLIGKFSICWDQPHPLAPQERIAASTIAGQLALAIVRFRAIDKLRESEERFRQFAENSADVFWIVDARRRKLEYLSPVFEQMFGDPRERIMRDINRWTELILPEDRDHGADMLARIVAGETVTVDYRIVRPNDGKIRWIRDTGFPIRDREGLVRRAAGLLQDITEEKESIEILRESEERFRLLVEGAREYAMFLLDPANIITFWSKGAERVFGWKAREALGRSGNLIFTPEDRARGEVEKEMNTALRTGVASDNRWHLQKKGNRIWVEGAMHRLEDGKGNVRGFAKVARDATLDRHAAEALHKAHDDLERRVRERTAELSDANKLLEKEAEKRRKLESEVLLISEREKRRIGEDLHDSLCQELAATAFILKTKAQTLGKTNAKEAAEFDEAARLVNENVGLARNLARGLHLVDVTATGLPDALRDFAFRRSNGRLTCRFECPKPVQVRSEAVAIQLYRVAQEAVTNAIKHGKPRQIVISLRRDHSALVLEVRDNGRGIQKKDNVKKGMGLEIMRHRASVIGGHLNIESRRGRGTKVTCTLPKE